MSKSKTKLDLSIGHPVFLQPYWNKLDLQPIKLKTAYPKETDQHLIKLIKKLHKLENNCNTDGKYVLFGNGATQFIGLISKALGEKVVAKPPFYYRFKHIVEKQGLQFKTKGLTGTRIVTLPNNPDNNAFYLNLQYGKSIYDLNYNWSIYTEPVCYNEDIMIFSASKGLGLASTRFAWAFFKDKELYLKVKELLYHDTVYVSKVTTDVMKQVFTNEIAKYKRGVFKVGKCILQKRWEQVLGKKLSFKLLNKSGMFLYAEGTPPKGILTLPGTLCGETDARFRINMGCSEADFKKLLKELK